MNSPGFRILLLLFLLSTPRSFAQTHYTQNNFSVLKTETDLVYGIETGYAGTSDTLRLDIYKPQGDLNCLRPLLILVHGGFWIAGSKSDAGIQQIANQMAAKGYIVAAINYRLGMHKASNYSMYWACNTNVSVPCAYISDSSEVFRALYRAMQDTKGAVRFMKDRALIDSTDVENVYLAGESAGGFTVMAAAFMRDTLQKPADCFSISAATSPDSDLSSCNPVGFSLARPDLGSIEGNLNTTQNNATVKGVASFYGGFLDSTLLNNSNQNPAVYLFHQGSDVVVDYQKNRVFGRINWECYAPTNLCQPYPFTPFVFGGEAIRRQLDSMGSQAPPYRADIIYNYNYMNDCFANGHSIDNISLRCFNMAELFSTIITASGNIPPMNCLPSSVEDFELENILVYPNPSAGNLKISFPKSIRIVSIRVLDLKGKEVNFVVEKDFSEIRLSEKIRAGIYMIEITTGKSRIMKKVIVQEDRVN
ncbi:MAG: T9SS type A sorting domain-containing protein [Bacteroidia bacterium]|nr:T9SS type A sorting domain-containing protein [Bacteroidia bacterium]